MSRHSIIAAENFAYSFRHINPSNYQLRTKGGVVVVWQATFSPTPCAEIFRGVCANCQMDETTLKKKIA